MAPKRNVTKRKKIVDIVNDTNPFLCPNPECAKRLRTEKGYRNHIRQSTNNCAEYVINQLAYDASIRAKLRGKVDAHVAEAVGVLLQNDPAAEESEEEDTAGFENAGAFSEDETPDNNPAADRNNPGRQRFNIAFTNAELAETKLLKLLGEAHAPHYMFKQILDWARQSHRLGYDFAATRTDRASQIRALKRMISSDGLPIPEPITTTISFDDVSPTGANVAPVTYFDFTTSLLSLLMDPTLTGDISQLEVDPDNVFGKFRSSSDNLSSVNSGAWYSTAYADQVRDASVDFLVPICFACDETTLNGMNRTSCWPLVFSTTLFSAQMRKLPQAWRPLGYIYDTSNDESKAQSKADLSSDAKARRLHAIFKQILESYVKVQRDGGIKNTTITLGQESKKVTLKVPCCFIIGDVPGGDKLCGRMASYSNKMNRMCRKCNVKGCESDDPYVQCYKIKQRKIVQWVDQQEIQLLKDCNQLNVRSAWFDVNFGGCPYGIFSAACPTEGLHSLELGLMADVLRVLFDDLKPTKCAQLDGMAKQIVLTWGRQKGLSSGADPTMPRLRWTDGITNLSLMNAKYKVGMMFTILVIALTDEGRAFFRGHFADEQQYRKMVYVFQLLLCYWVWLKKKSFWSRGDIAARQKAKQAIIIMLAELKDLWPRLEGQGWCKPKFHEQLHVPDDIERNGAPENYHTGPTEHHHLWHVKRLSRTTQRRRAVLDEQLAARTSEAYVIETAYQRMTFPYDEIAPSRPAKFPPASISPHSATFTVSFALQLDRYVDVQSIRCHGFSEDASRGSLAPCCNVVVLNRILDQLYDERVAETHLVLKFASEYKRAGQVFRAHPDYRKGGPWHDWAVFRWERMSLSSAARARVNRSVHDSQIFYGDNPTIARYHDYSPGRIVAFHQCAGGIYAIADCCGLSHMKNSVFTTEWRLEDPVGVDGIQIVDTESIVRQSLMVPKNSDDGTYNEVWQRDRWASEFV